MCATSVVVAPATFVDRARALAGDSVVVVGGETRQDSVAAGLAALAADVDVVLVHDAARAFVPVEVIGRVLAAVAGGADAVVPALPLVDTVKRVDAHGAVTATVDRSELRAVQTPQGFRRAALVGAHERWPGDAVTDDAGLVERAGGRVVVVDGADEAFKITRPWDLRIAESLADR